MILLMKTRRNEADYLGLIFSSLSGYDIRESVKLWQRMAEKNKGKETASIPKHSPFLVQKNRTSTPDRGGHGFQYPLN